MIQAIWIISDTGQCIFSHKYVPMDIEDQLISGLLTAFDAFSKESGIGGVQEIGGEDNQFVYGTTGKVFVAALADKKDNSRLVENLMNKISVAFQEKYAAYLDEAAFVNLEIFSGFEKEIDNILYPKVFKRGAGSTIFGTLVTIAFTIGVVLSTLNIIGATNSAFLIFLACIPGLFIGSLVSGTRTYALISSIIGISPIVGYTGYSILAPAIEAGDLDQILIVVLMAQQFFTIAILAAIAGGGLIERRRLFPLEKASKKQQAEPEIQVQPLPTLPDLGGQLEQQQQQSDTQTTEEYYAQSSFIQEEQTHQPPSQQKDW